MRSKLLASIAALGLASTALAGGNILANGDLETPGPGFIPFQDWGFFNNVLADDNNLPGTEVMAESGARSAKMFGQFAPEAQTEAGLFQEVMVIPGNEYTLTGFTLSLASDALQPLDTMGSPGGGNFGHIVLAIIDFKNMSGGVIGSAEVNAFEPGVSSNDVWVPFELTATAPEGAVTAQVTLLFLQFDLAGGSLFWDTISLTEGEGEPQPCNAADLAEPFGELNFNDVIAFLGIFANGCP